MRFLFLSALLAVVAADIGHLYRSSVVETSLQQPSGGRMARSHGDGHSTYHLYLGGFGNSSALLIVYAVEPGQPTPLEVQVFQAPFREFPAVIVVSPDNRHVYAAVGGYMTPAYLYTMARASTGELTFVSEYRFPTARTIRDLAFDPTGRRLWVGRETLGWLIRNPETGAVSDWQTIDVGTEVMRVEVASTGQHLYTVTYEGGLQLYDTSRLSSPPVLIDEHVFSDTLGSGLAVTDQFVYAADYRGLLTVWRRDPSSGRLSMHQPIRTRLANVLSWIVPTSFALYAGDEQLGVLAWRLDNRTGRLVSIDPMMQWPGVVGGLVLSQSGEALWAARGSSRAFQRFDIETPCGVGVPCREGQEQVMTAMLREVAKPIANTLCTIRDPRFGSGCAFRPLDRRSTWCQQGSVRLGVDRVPLEWDLTQSLNSVLIEDEEGYVAFALSNQRPFVAGYESKDALSIRNHPSQRQVSLSLTDEGELWRVCEGRECCRVPREEGGECELSSFRRARVTPTDDCESGWQVIHTDTRPGSRPDQTVVCMVHPPRPVTPLTLYQSTSILSPGYARRTTLNAQVTVRCYDQSE